MDDEQRDTAIVKLQDHYAKNRLEIEEFERRVELAERASTQVDLDRALDGLPITAELVPLRDASPVTTVKAVLGNTARRGRWQVPARVVASTFMGNVELDLTDAELGRGETVLEARATLGNVTILVADDLAVECEGSAVLGSFEHMGQRPRSNKDPRRLRIVGRAVLGNVEIVVRKRAPPSLLESVRDSVRDGVRGLLGK
jgi:hypothetical protein